MWASARSNLPKDKEVGGQGRGMKCNEEAIGEEKQSTTLQMWNEMKELRMANTVEQGRIYEALKIVIALNIVICSLLVMMMLK